MALSTPLEHGEIIHLDVADPIAGAQAVQLLSTNYQYKLLGVTFLLTTDATAISRRPGLEIDQSAPITRHILTPVGISASLAITVSFLPGYNLETSVIGNSFCTNLPFPIILNGGESVRTLITDLQAADEITNMKIFLSRWRMQNF